MATVNLANITQKGTSAAFNHAIASYPSIWDKYCMNTPSTAGSETYVWPGFLPEPREMLHGRDLQGIMDFTYNVENKEYELSFKIARKTVEDDQHAMIAMRIAEAAQVWAMWKDYLFSFMVYEGDSTTAYATAFDALAFNADTRTIGGSANIDNKLADTSITTAASPTSTEVLSTVRQCLNSMWRFQDDKGRPMTAAAMQQVRVIIPPEFQRAFLEAFNSTVISQSDNPWGRQIGEFDISPFLQATGTDTAFWVCGVGAPRKPYIYQERTPLEIIVYNSTNDVAENNGTKVLCRQRFVFAYGEPRYCVRMDIS
jgi:phage major head subunit gpT-like protein